MQATQYSVLHQICIGETAALTAYINERKRLFLGSAYKDIAEVRPSNRTSRLIRSCDRTRETGYYALNTMDDMERSEP
jgi:hypothetical protein